MKKVYAPSMIDTILGRVATHTVAFVDRSKAVNFIFEAATKLANSTRPSQPDPEIENVLACILEAVDLHDYDGVLALLPQIGAQATILELDIDEEPNLMLN